MSDLSPPTVLRWFKVYAGVQTALYGICLFVGLLLIFVGARSLEDGREVLVVLGVVLAITGLLLGPACALSFFLPRQPWVWIYDLVIICVGMFNGFLAPLCVTLLIYWTKPEAKAWFHRV
jgi:hypothetical protein